MTRRIDGHLSSIAQRDLDPRATVWCAEFRGTSSDLQPKALDYWTLEIPDAPTVGLGSTFKDANQAVKALVRAKRAGG